jgi:hypothetical protein
MVCHGTVHARCARQHLSSHQLDFLISIEIMKFICVCLCVCVFVRTQRKHMDGNTVRIFGWMFACVPLARNACVWL